MKVFVPPAQPLDIIVFDFDGVLAEPMWPAPQIGAPIKEGLKLLHEYHRLGFQITIHTSRPESHKASIWQFLARVGASTAVYDIVCNKPLGVLYVDDRALRFER